MSNLIDDPLWPDGKEIVAKQELDNAEAKQIVFVATNRDGEIIGAYSTKERAHENSAYVVGLIVDYGVTASSAETRAPVGPLHAKDDNGRCQPWCYACERQGLIERIKFTADFESVKLALHQAEQARDAALNLLADEQNESATRSWPRVAELSNELAETKATLHQLLRRCDAESLRASKAETALRQAKDAIANQRGDDLCWLTDADLETVKALPAAEFLESCRRYHAQLVAERGEATGLKTIAQLEAENEQLREERDEAQHERDHVIKMSQRAGYDAEREGAAFFAGLLEPDKPHDKYAMAIAALKLWANSYLLKGNYWDVPHTMGAMLNQIITTLESER